MNHKALFGAFVMALAGAGLAMGNAALAGNKNVTLPADGVQLKPSALPGYAKGQAIA